MTKMIVRTEKGSGYIFGKTFATMRKIAVVLLVVCALVPSKVLVRAGFGKLPEGALELYAAVDKCYAGAVQYWWDEDAYRVQFKSHDPLTFGVGTEDIVAVVYHARSQTFGCTATGPPMMVQWANEDAATRDKITIQKLFEGQINKFTGSNTFNEIVEPASLTKKRPYNIADSVVVIYAMTSRRVDPEELKKQNTSYTPLACGVITNNEEARAAFIKKLNSSPEPTKLKKTAMFIFNTIFVILEILLFLLLWWILFVILCCRIICFRQY